MKHTLVVLSLSLGLVGSRVAAQDVAEFTLEEADGPSAPPPRRARASSGSRQAIANSLGALRWGMSKADVIKLLKAQIQAEFEQRIKVERDIMRQDALYQEAQERARRFNESTVEFDGQKTGWDVSPVANEFTHGNREAMMVVTSKGARDMYFFIQGKLWKWFRELPQTRAVDPEEVLGAFKERFGAGQPQRERRDEADVLYPGATWSDGSTRVTVLRRGGDTCLIFEDLQTIDRLAVLRHHVQPKTRGPRSASVIDSILLSDAEREARSR